jgi:hypothetical protein
VAGSLWPSYWTFGFLKRQAVSSLNGIYHRKNEVGYFVKCMPTNSNKINVFLFGNRNSLIGVTTNLRLDCCGSIASRDKIFSSTPYRPDRPWSTPSLLRNGCRGLFSQGKTAGTSSWSPISIYTRILPRSRMVGLYHYSSRHPNGVTFTNVAVCCVLIFLK